MFSQNKSDQVLLIQQCLANYDYPNATLLAEELLFQQESEENKGLLADCYLAQEENHKAYFLLKNCTSPMNKYKFAVTSIRLNRLTEAEAVLTHENAPQGDDIPNGAFGLQLLANVYEKQNKFPQAKQCYEKALESNAKLLAIRKKLTRLSQGFNDVKPENIEERKEKKLDYESLSRQKNVQTSSNQPSNGGVSESGCEDERRSDRLFGSENKPQGGGLLVGLTGGGGRLFGIGRGFDERTGGIFNSGDKPQGGGLFSSGNKLQEGGLLVGPTGGGGGLFGSGSGSQGGSGGLFSNGLEVKVEEKSPYEIIDSVSPGEGKKEKGVNQVDEYFDEKEEDCEVYVSEEGKGKVYSKTLNQSSSTEKNDNFYIIQVLQSTKNRGRFFLWVRWGTVGVKGNVMKKRYGSVQEAIDDFENMLSDKTIKDDYVEVGVTGDDEEEKVDENELPQQTKDLIELIFDLEMMNNQMKEIGYDTSRVPLGKLSQDAIKKGYEILSELAQALKEKKSNDIISQISSQFYHEIPHDFGFRQMSAFNLDTDNKIKEKLEMLASLENIQIAINLLESDSKRAGANYNKLKCDLTPCEKDSDEHNMVLDFLKNTHGSAHYSYSLELLDLFSVKREGEAERFTKDLHNKQLLWYGSRLTNYVSILSQGLKIAPPEAPVTAYTFGKGVYFADMVSKAANLCFTNPQNDTGILLLCEVALGGCNEKLRADCNAANLPSGKHSTKGFGRMAPSASEARTIDGDVVVRTGKLKNTGVARCELLYNEYVVYDVKQIKIRYLVKVKFNYKYNY